MAYTDIDKPSDYFNTKLYTGNGTTNTGITGVNFQPDFTWIKNRTSADAHILFDSIRGATYRLNSNTINSEFSIAESLKSFDSDGFTVGTYSEANTSGQNYTSWNWLASNTTASNNDGSITSTVSANTTSGFSIVSYTGTGSNATIGHALGTSPSVIFIKERTVLRDWRVYHKSITANNHLYLNDTTASTVGATQFNNTEPTSSVFSVGTSVGTNESGETFIAYCFAEKKGFSKFSSYTGNGSTDGTFVYTGFKPAFVLIKSSSLSQDWFIHDNKRSTFNVSNTVLLPNTVDLDITDTTVYGIDMVSNGFKVRGTHARINQSGASYIYMAFAENPFVTSSGIPTPAR